MSARIVCSGTRPSEYCSVRAISAPPRRPDTWILQPLAPERMALVSARFIARRKATRLCSCSALDCATRVASRARGRGAGRRALHRAAEGAAVLQLLGDRLRDELGVELRALDLEDVDLDPLARQPVQVLAQGVDLGAGRSEERG